MLNRKFIMKRYFLILQITLCGLIFALASCVKSTQLTILGEDSSNLQAFETLKKQYEKEFDVTLAFRPNTFEDARVKADQDFINQTGLFDIVMLYNFSLSSYVRNNYVWNRDSLIQIATDPDTSFMNDNKFTFAWNEVGSYYKNPSKPTEGEIQRIGFPFATNTMLLVYNKRMFENKKNQEAFRKIYKRELDVPTDWEHFRQIAQFFTKENTYGVCMQGTGDWLYYEYCDFLYGMGGSIFDKKYGWEGDQNTPITINSKEAEAATRFYLSLKPYNKGDYYNTDATEQVRMILEGDVAMGLVWSDYLYGFVKSDKRSSRFGYAPLPGGKSPIAGGCFFVNRNSEHAKEAIDFILYIMKPDVQSKLALNGLCSPLSKTYDDSVVINKIPYAKALGQSLEDERSIYMYEAGLESGEVSEIIADHIQRLWRSGNQDDVKSVLRMIEVDIETARQDIYKNLD